MTQSPLHLQVLEANATRTVTPEPAPSASKGWIAVAVALTVAAGAFAFFGVVRLRAGYQTIDDARLVAAEHMFQQSQDSAHHLLESQAAVIANDGRVRATLATPGIDAATLRDLLDDVRASSGAGLLALLTPAGVVTAASGEQKLEGIDLSTSEVVKRLLGGEDMAGGSWTYGTSAMNIGAARVRLGPRLAGVLLVGNAVPAETFTAIEAALSVHGALVIGREVSAASASAPPSPVVARLLANSTDADYAFIVRDLAAGAAARVVWLVPHHVVAPDFFGVVIALIGLMALTGVASIALLWYAWRA